MKLPKLLVASTVSNDGEQAKEAAPLAYPALKVEGDPSAILTFTRTVRYPDPQILANGVPAFRAIESARDLVSGGVIRIPSSRSAATRSSPPSFSPPSPTTPACPSTRSS